MTKLELTEYLAALNLSLSDAAQLLNVSERTVRRWAEGEAIPGPVEAALVAWRSLHERHLPWKPNSISIRENDQDQIQRQTDEDRLLAQLLKEVEAQGGPANPWSVDLVKQRATFGPAEVAFYRLSNGGFSPSTYRRKDRTPVEADRQEIRDACYCIAQAFSAARQANESILDVAAYTRKHAQFFVQEGPSSHSAEDAQKISTRICGVADELEVLAISALDGRALYSQFEVLLDGLHRLGFFPDIALVSAVARSMLAKTRLMEASAE